MNTTHTKELTELSEKPKAGQLLETISLRDYFAAKAMQEFLDEVGSQSDQAWFNQIAKNAYRMADAMMKAREA